MTRPLRRSRSYGAACLVAYAITVSVTTAHAQPAPPAGEFPPAPASGWTYDATGSLDVVTRQQITELTDATWRTSHVRLGVALVPDTGARTIETYSLGLFRAWRMGEDTEGRAALLVIAVQTRKNRVEIGSELRDRLTDDDAQRVLTEVFRPTARASGPGLASLRTLEALRARIEGTSTTASPPSGQEDDSIFGYLLRGLCIAVVVGLVVGAVASHRARKRRRREQVAYVEQRLQEGRAIRDALLAEGFATAALKLVDDARESFTIACEQYRDWPDEMQADAMSAARRDLKQAAQWVRDERLVAAAEIEAGLCEIDRHATLFRELVAKLGPLATVASPTNPGAGPYRQADDGTERFAPLRAQIEGARRHLDHKPYNPRAARQETALAVLASAEHVAPLQKLDAFVTGVHERFDALKRGAEALPEALREADEKLQKVAARWPRVDFTSDREAVARALRDTESLPREVTALGERLAPIDDATELERLEQKLDAAEAKLRRLSEPTKLPAEREAALVRAESDIAAYEKRLNADTVAAMREAHGAKYPALVEAFAAAQRRVETMRELGDPRALAVAFVAASRALDAIHEAARPPVAASSSYAASSFSNDSSYSSDCTSSYSSDCASSDCASSYSSDCASSDCASSDCSSSDCSGSSSDW